MTVHDYVAALRKYWILILALGLVGAGAAYGYSQLLPAQYRSEAQVMVIAARGDNTNELVQGSNYVQNLVQSYTILATSPLVLEPVIEELGLDESAYGLARRVNAQSPLNTVIIGISVADVSPEGAQVIANAVVDEFSQRVGQVSPRGEDGSPAVRIETIAPARLASVPVAPNTRINVAIGAAAGIALGVIFALLRRRFASRIANADDVRDATDAPMLGEIVAASDSLNVAATLRSNPDGRVAESLRQVTASLKFVDVDKDRRVIMVTSGSSGEGKSSVSMSLALTLAEVGHTVLYMEADLRRPSAVRYTQLEGSVGLTTVLIGDATLEAAAQPWGHPGLSVLTSGALPPNPGQLLSSGQLRQVIDEARFLYEYVIVDTAPVLSVSDALWLSSFVDGTLFVVRADKTKRDDLTRAVAALESTRTPVLGVVLNGAKGDTKSPYYVPDAKPALRPRGRRRQKKSKRPSAPR